MGLNVLLAEGNDHDAFLIRRAVMRSSSSVNLSVVADGVSVMLYLQGQPPYSRRELPSLILLDARLPMFCGFDILHWIRSQPEFCGIPIALLVDSLKQIEGQTVPETGADMVFVKPGTASEWFSTFLYFAERPRSLHPQGQPASQQSLALPVGA